MKVDVIRGTRCSGMILTSHTGMAQARRQLPVTKENKKKSSIFMRRIVTPQYGYLPHTPQEGSFSLSLRGKSKEVIVLVNKRLSQDVGCLISPVADGNRRLCHSLKATLPYRICCWLGGYSSHHPSIVFRVSSRRCTSGETIHSSDSFAPWLAVFIARMNSTRLLHALEARNFGISFTVLNNRSGAMKPLSCRGSIIAGGATSAEGVLQQDDALNKMRSIACPPLAVSPHCLETLTPSPFDDATKHAYACMPKQAVTYYFRVKK